MTQLGKYEILEEIGRGGFGVVYKARDLSLERDVALKVLHPQLTVDLNFLERFRKEARTLAKINHPNVVTVYEIGEVEGRVFIAMEYLPGGSLADRLEREGPLKLPEALEITNMVSAGLAAGHKRGIIHRDVKPCNILFDEEGQAVIADFGVARAVKLSSLGTTTQSSGTVGTPFYRPPELWRGTPPPSPATDVYSLACVLYEMLTGEVLFTGDTPDQVLTRHVLEDACDLMRVGAQEIPEPLQAVLVQALAKDPQARYLGTNNFIEALTQAQKPTETVIRQNPKPAAAQTTTRAEPPVKKPGKRHPPTQPTAITPRAVAKPPDKPIPGKQRLLPWLPWLVAGMMGVVLLKVLVTGNLHPDSTVKDEPAAIGVASGINEASLPASMERPEPTVTETSLPLPTATETRVPTPTPTTEPTPVIILTKVNEKDKAVMVFVPEGKFLMGSEDEDAYDDEAPEHLVWLDAFWIYQTEVTNAQFEAFIDATDYQTTAEEAGWSYVFKNDNWEKKMTHTGLHRRDQAAVLMGEKTTRWCR
jgi:eukaryotic-like serine/threonine-protein kinase